jgi:integrase
VSKASSSSWKSTHRTISRTSSAGSPMKASWIGARSVDYVHVTLQKALNQAIRDDLVPRNVAYGERTQSSRDREESKAPSQDRVKTLLRTSKGERNAALYVVAVHTGLRKGELLDPEARRSRGVSATYWWTPKASCSRPRSTAPK